MPHPETTDPLLALLANAPADDEPWTDEDEASAFADRFVAEHRKTFDRLAR